MNKEQSEKQPKTIMSRQEYIEAIVRLANKLQTDEAVRELWILTTDYYNRGQ